VFKDAKDTIYGQGVMTTQIPLSVTENHGRTFYNAHGDVFGWVCVAWLAVLAGRKVAVWWAGVQRKADRQTNK
jgi:hypothetical protein